MNAGQIDPKWTAYALGEAGEADVAALRDALASDAALREHVEHVEVLARWLGDALQMPGVPTALDAKRQARILQAAVANERPSASRRQGAVRIDLRARLGKAESTPREASPRGIAPPADLLASPFPAAPFSPHRARRQDPFAAVAAVDAVPEIRVEIGHDVLVARKQARTRIVVTAALACAVGIGVGWTAGSLRTRAAADLASIQGAQSLVDPVRRSAAEVTSLDAALSEATRSLYEKKQYPEDLSKQLALVDISFSGAELVGKNLQRVDRSIVRGLIDYARDAQELNARKEALARLFNARKTDIVSMLEQSKDPRIGYSVVVQRDREGNVVGTFARVAKPWAFDSKAWPDKVGLHTGQSVVDAERYKSGDPLAPGRDGKPVIRVIPVEPDGVTRAFPSPLAQRIEAELGAMRVLIHGTKPGEVGPDDEKRGLLQRAGELERELEAVGAKR